MRMIKAIGSLPIAVFLISALTGILILSTALESVHGTPFAQAAFYEAKWFDLFLTLIWVNIFCATLSRWPFKKRHIGFIITHIGILTILIGALLTRLTGAEGQMTLLEGEQWDRIQQKGSDLLAAPQEGPAYQFRLPERASGRPQRLKVPDSKLELFLQERSDRIGTRIAVKNSGEFFNPAVQFTLSSERAGVRRQLWLIARDAENAYSDAFEMGPAHFHLEDADEAAEAAAAAASRPKDKPARLILSDKSGRPIGSIDLPAEPGAKVAIDEGRFTVTDLRFLPYARVSGNKLINDDQDVAARKWNPAVEFTVRGPDGIMEKHTRFALFPEFDSLHGKDTPNVFDLKVELKAAGPDDPKHGDGHGGGPELVFQARENGEWTWRSTKSDGTSRSGTVKKGGEFETGWMDMKVRVDRVVPRAEVSRTVGPLADVPSAAGTAGDEDAEVGAKVSYTDTDGAKREGWVLMSRPLEILTPAGKWTLSLTDRSLKVPFTLQLKDFRKVDYPGTSNPASFESDVTLFDGAKGVKIERTIKMNEPLDYAGWRVFQSSYIQDPQFGEASVFTIAKNPGILPTYAGAIILLIGVITLFYVKPFGSGQHVH